MADEINGQIETLDIVLSSSNAPVGVAWTQVRAALARLRDENAAMKRGEFICTKCGLRHDSDESNQVVDF